MLLVVCCQNNRRSPTSAQLKTQFIQRCLRSHSAFVEASSLTPCVIIRYINCNCNPHLVRQKSWQNDVYKYELYWTPSLFFIRAFVDVVSSEVRFFEPKWVLNKGGDDRKLRHRQLDRWWLPLCLHMERTSWQTGLGNLGRKRRTKNRSNPPFREWGTLSFQIRRGSGII